MRRYLHAPHNAGATPVRIELQLHAITNEHFNSVQTHFTGEVCQDDISAFELDAKEGIREGLIDDSFYNLCFSHNLRDKYSNPRGGRQVYCPFASPTETSIAAGSTGNVLRQNGSTRA